MNTKHRRVLAYFETVLSAIACVLAILTIFWRDWIEGLTGWDPDHHNGSFEILIICGLAIVGVLVGLAARHTWRQVGSAAPAQ
jgi:undecaprenyl pyrophosphate phosphatase UppP